VAISWSDSRLWISWHEVEARAAGRAVVLYGRSEDWAHKAISNSPLPVVAILDRDPTYHGSQYKNLPILGIEELSKLRDHFVVITASQFHGIVETLESFGFKAGEDFVCSPDFRDYHDLLELRSVSPTILISSSDYRDSSRARYSKLGGGLYLLNTESGKLDSIYEGSTRQLVRINGGRLAVVDYVSRQLIILDSDLAVDKRVNLAHANACGLAYSDHDGFLVIANSGRDTLSVYEVENWRLVKELTMGTAWGGSGGHHLNDLTIDGSVLYASYFSWSGGFKQGIYDGGVAAWDLLNMEKGPTPILSNLWKPHSPTIIEGRVHILDSMRGQLRTGLPKPRVTLNAFVRGLDSVDGVLVIGHSEDMYVTERTFVSQETIMANAGVSIMRNKNHVIPMARFVPTPQLMNIHDLTIWKDSLP
jgi:hypothetical protein